MNAEDIDKGSDMVMVSNTFVSGRRVKQGATIEMGCEESILIAAMTGKYIPILVFVKKEEYDKRCN